MVFLESISVFHAQIRYPFIFLKIIKSFLISKNKKFSQIIFLIFISYVYFFYTY